MTERRTVAPGDWIRIPALFPGVWLVSRVLTRFYEDRWSLDKPKQMSDRTLVFCDRLVNDTWNRSFSRQCCAESYVNHLSEEDSSKLRALLAGDSKLTAAFEKYRASTAPLDLIANISIGRLTDHDVSSLQQLCSDVLAPRIASGVTVDEVLMLLRERDLEKHIAATPIQMTLRLTSKGHELRGDEFLYRTFRTSGF